MQICSLFFVSSPECLEILGSSTDLMSSHLHHYHFQLCPDHVYSICEKIFFLFFFCLLIFLHASPFETTVKMKPFLFIFRVEPGGPPSSEGPVFAFLKCDVMYLQGVTPRNPFPGSALLSEKHQVKTDPLETT